MNTFDPGPGWRETSDYATAELVLYPNGQMKGSVAWVREDPVPRLPTEPYTVIDAWWGTENHRVMHLYEGAWYSLGGNRYQDSEMAQVTRFEVLSEPRATTAKAIVKWLSDHDYPERADDIAEAFGVNDG